MPPLRPGNAIGRYRIESRLGSGGMGVVYLATDVALERRVALKVIAPELAADAEFRSRFASEGRAAAAVDHPHLLPVFDSGEADGQLFLAMRYVPGFDLGTILARDGALPVERTITLIAQLASALDKIHAAGLVHRDVKPANVLVGGDGHAYLSDFGLARAALTPGLTRLGQTAVGSAEYLAPELIAGDAADPAADRYALGCLAFACLTGRSPFRRTTDMATLYAHAHDPVPPLASVRPDLPRGLDVVLARALAKGQRERYPSAGEFAAALAAATGGAVATSTGPASSATNPPAIRRHGVRSRVLVAISLLGSVALLGGSLLFSRSELGGDDVRQSPIPSIAERSTPVATASAPSPSEPVAGATVVELERDDAGYSIDQYVLTPGVAYEMEFTRPTTRFEVPGPGWYATEAQVDQFHLIRHGEGGMGFPHWFSMGVVQVVSDGPCVESPTRIIEPDPQAFIAFVLEHPTIDATDPIPVNFGSYSGLSTQISIATAPEPGACEALPEDVDEAFRQRFAARTHLFHLGDDVFHISPGEREELVAVNVEGRLIVISYGTVESSAWESFRSEARELLKTIEFAP